ncbi:MAG TPA: hypothetical protein VFI53_03745 [Myxococcaceae bacterium]|nr:hypothetical protein [Myxococcaceae bacterium]
MRSSLTVALALVAASCAHHPPPSPTLAGTVGELHFDSESVTSVGGGMKLTSDGTWVGWFPYWGRLEITRSGVQIHGIAWGDRISGDTPVQFNVPVTTDHRFVAVHEGNADLVFERADGGPVPDALVVPLWLATRRDAYYLGAAPHGRCVEVEGIGTVVVLALPRRAVPYDIGLEEGCRIRFTEPVVQGGPLEVDPGP